MSGLATRENVVSFQMYEACLQLFVQTRVARRLARASPAV